MEQKLSSTSDDPADLDEKRLSLADTSVARPQLNLPDTMGMWGIAGDLLWDGINDEVREGLCVVVLRDRIASLCTLSEACRRGVPVQHFPACCIMPGMIDAHVHMEFSEHFPLHEQPKLTCHELRAAMEARALRMVQHGITAARDLGGTSTFAAVDLRNDIMAGRVVGPRLVCAGQPITCPNGHCHQWGGVVNSMAEIRPMINKQVERGVDWIKVMATGGLRTPGTNPQKAQFSEDWLFEIVAASTSHGRPVAAHAHGTAGITAAVRAGCHTIEHCSWIGQFGWCSGVDDATIQEMSKKGVYVSPTAHAKWTRKPMGEAGYERMCTAFGRLRRQNVPLVASSDAGAIPGLPHEALAGGVNVLATMASMGAPEALRAATSCCANAIGIGDVCGQLSEGYAADLLLVSGNPCRDLKALRRPRMVVSRGNLVDPCVMPHFDSTM